MEDIARLRLSVDSGLVRRADGDLGRFRNSASRAAQEAQRLERASRALAAAMGAIAAAASAAFALRGVQQLTDAYRRAENQIKSVASSTNELRAAQEGLFAVSQRTASSFTENAGLYARLQRSSAELAADQAKTLQVVENVNKALQIGGASTAERQSTILQLGQGLSAGALQGDEARAIRENAPLLAQAIAEAAGYGIEAFRQLSAEGKLTREVVVAGLLSIGDEISETYAGVSFTIEDAFTRVRNSLQKLFGENLGGIQDVLVDALTGLSQALDSEAAAVGLRTLLVVIEDIARAAGAAAIAVGAFLAALAVARIAAAVASFVSLAVVLARVHAALGQTTLAMGALSVASVRLQAVFAGLSAIIAANPIGAAVVAVAALSAAFVTLAAHRDDVYALFGAFDDLNPAMEQNANLIERINALQGMAATKTLEEAEARKALTQSLLEETRARIGAMTEQLRLELSALDAAKARSSLAEGMASPALSGVPGMVPGVVAAVAGLEQDIINKRTERIDAEIQALLVAYGEADAVLERLEESSADWGRSGAGAAKSIESATSAATTAAEKLAAEQKAAAAEAERIKKTIDAQRKAIELEISANNAFATNATLTPEERDIADEMVRLSKENKELYESTGDAAERILRADAERVVASRENREAAERIAEVYDNAERSIGGAVDQFARDLATKGFEAFDSLGDYAKRVFADISSDIVSALLDPLKNALTKLASNAISSIFDPFLGYLGLGGGGSGVIINAGGGSGGGFGGGFSFSGGYGGTGGFNLQGLGSSLAGPLQLAGLAGGGPGFGLLGTAASVVGSGGIGALLSPGAWFGAAGGLGAGIGGAIGSGIGGLFNAAGAGQVIGAGLGSFVGIGSIGTAIGQLLGLGSGNGLQDSIIGGIGGIAGGAIGGAALGTALGSFAGPVGAIVGSLLGTALSGLFGGKAYPFAFSEVSSTSSGELGLEGIYAKHGGSEANDALRQITDGASQALQAVLDAVGGTYTGTRLGVGYSEKTGGFFVDKGRNQERIAGGIQDAEEALTALFNASVKFGSFEGGDEAATKLVKALAEANVGIEDTARILDTYTAATKSASDETSKWRKAIDEINSTFGGLIDELGGIAGTGDAVAALKEAQAEALQGLADSFDDEIDRAIRQAEEPLALAFEDLINAQADRIRDAIDVGGDLDAVEQLNQIELQAFVDQAIAGGAALDDLNAQFEALIETARELGRTTEEVAAIEAAYASARAQAVTAFDEGVSDRLLALTNPSLAALEALLEAQANRLQTAEELGANIAAVERLNALEMSSFLDGLSDDDKRRLGDYLGLIEDFTGRIGVVLAGAVGEIDDALSDVEALRDRITDDAEAARKHGDDYTALSQSLKDQFGDLSPRAGLDDIRSRFATLAEDARAGNESALTALPQLAQQLIDRSRELYGSTAPFQNDLDAVTAVLDELGASQSTRADDLEAQLVALDQQVELLTQIRDALGASDPNFGFLDDAAGQLVGGAFDTIAAKLIEYIDLSRRQDAADADINNRLTADEVLSMIASPSPLPPDPIVYPAVPVARPGDDDQQPASGLVGGRPTPPANPGPITYPTPTPPTSRYPVEPHSPTATDINGLTRGVQVVAQTVDETGAVTQAQLDELQRLARTTNDLLALILRNQAA